MRVATFSQLGRLATALLLLAGNVIVIVMTIVPSVMRIVFAGSSTLGVDSAATRSTYIFQIIAHSVMALFFIISGILLQCKLRQAASLKQRQQPSELQQRMLRFLLADSAMMIGSAIISGFYFRLDSITSYFVITALYFFFLSGTSSSQIFIFYRPRSRSPGPDVTSSQPPHDDILSDQSICEMWSQSVSLSTQ